MPYLFFTSYARANTRYPSDAKLLEQFVRDLEAEVDQLPGTPAAGRVCFFDRTDIETGATWPDELEEALCTSRVIVPLYSPAYFVSDWCGKELRVFLDRGQLAPGLRPIVPALWIAGAAPPENIGLIQYEHGAFPREYWELGLRKLMQVGSYKDAYVQSLSALAQAIISSLAAPALPELAEVNLSGGTSAWIRATTPQAHTSGAISKTCFVFVANEGRDWRPYPQTNRIKIGSIAQVLSGQLDLEYVEIPCDRALCERLRDTHRSNVPTVLLGDPASLTSEPFLQLMSEYDTLYLLNCGALLPWESNDMLDSRIAELQRKVFRQKIPSPPPNHEWRSIFSEHELWQRTRETIECIRLRLLGEILSNGSGAPVLKAGSAELSAGAARVGLNLDAAPRVIAVAPQQG